MAAAVPTARQRYRWVLLLVAAAILLAWLVTGGGRGSEPVGDASTSSTPTSTSSAHDTSTGPPASDLPSDPASDPGGSLGTDAVSGLPVVRLADLPPEAARTVELIDAGGPFPEPEHDGGTFGNREELLPDRPAGYYREYTVPTPGLGHRGARRLVAGEGGELYWTDDHYSSFSRIARQ